MRNAIIILEPMLGSLIFYTTTLTRASHADAIGPNAASSNNKNPLTESSLTKAAEADYSASDPKDDEAYKQAVAIYREHEIKLLHFVLQKLQLLHGEMAKNLGEVNMLLDKIYAINQDIFNSFQKLAENTDAYMQAHKLGAKRACLNFFKNVCTFGKYNKQEKSDFYCTIETLRNCEVEAIETRFGNGKTSYEGFFEACEGEVKIDRKRIFDEVKGFVSNAEELKDSPFAQCDLEEKNKELEAASQ